MFNIVDDITLSTNRKISFEEEKQLKAIIKKYGQKISKGKTIRYDNNEYKKLLVLLYLHNIS